MLRGLNHKVWTAKLIGVILTAWLLACSFPLPPWLADLEGGGAAWLSLIPLMVVIRCSSPKSAFGWGWISGFLFWLLSLSWLLALRHTWGNSIFPVLGWLFLSAYCALYMGAFSFLFATVPAKPACEQGEEPLWHPWTTGYRLIPLLAAPLFWVATEIVRATFFTGFPWNLLGVSQYQNVAALQVASVGGVYAVSALVVLLNAAMALTVLRIGKELRHRPTRRRFHVELMVGLASVAVAWSWGVRTVRRESLSEDLFRLRVAAVQPAIPQIQKWDEEHERDLFRALREQTEMALLSRPDLIVWPETALPGLLRYDPVSWQFTEDLARGGAWLLAGTMDAEYTPSGTRLFYNSSFLLSPEGDIADVYHKRHLVLFGEYLPFQRRFPFVARWAPLGLTCEPGPMAPPLMQLVFDNEGRNRDPESVLFSTLICFEDSFAYLARADVRRGARFLVNQTNNAWFDGSSASRQHMANAILRTVENRVPMVRSANTGITCFVDRFGRIRELFATQQGVVDARGFSVAEMAVPLADADMTLYTRYGDWLLAIPSLALSLLYLIWLALRRYRRRLLCP